MKGPKLRLFLLSGTFSICRLEKNSPTPNWVTKGSFSSITRTPEELSVICPEVQVPRGVKREAGWRALKVEGPLDFSLTGILSSLTAALAQKGIGVFALSTYDTDYLFVKDKKLEKAIQALREEGYAINKVRSAELGVRSRRKRLRPEGSSPKSGRPYKS